MPEGVINNLGILFQVKRKLSIEQAREILVDCVQEFLTEINSNEEIRPYLENFPFTSKNIHIALLTFAEDAFLQFGGHAARRGPR